MGFRRGMRRVLALGMGCPDECSCKNCDVTHASWRGLLFSMSNDWLKIDRMGMSASKDCCYWCYKDCQKSTGCGPLIKLVTSDHYKGVRARGCIRLLVVTVKEE
jgi:hypothetical protein